MLAQMERFLKQAVVDKNPFMYDTLDTTALDIALHCTAPRHRLALGTL